MITDKNELKILGFTQRIGEIASNYEARIIDLRADLTIEIQRLEKENKSLKEEVDRLKETLGGNDVAVSKEG
jgi:hypothetical protein